MTIDKLPSGKYRIRQMIDGKRYSVILDHRPSQIEASKIIAKMADRAPRSNNNMTVLDACTAYLDAKNNVLSPSTIRGYKGVIRAISEDFKGIYINSMTSALLQKEVNDYAKGRSPKTVSNFAHFLTAVFAFYDVEVKPPILPMKVKMAKYIPTIDDVNAILREAEGTKYEVFFRLAMYGLRRSEVAALTLSDLSDDNTLTINKAVVTDGDNQNVIKPTKTTDSARMIKIDDELADMIRKQGYVWEGHIAQPYKHLRDIQDFLGLPAFSLHTFRHFFASYLHEKGLTDKQIQEIGGWKTDHVMKTVYQHAMEMEQTRNEVAQLFGHEIGHKKSKTQ